MWFSKHFQPQQRHSHYLLAFLILSSFASAQPTQETPNPWPQWRGEARDGHVTGPAWPEQLTESSLALLWRVPLGPSYSGPIVTQTAVFTTETRDKNSEVVHALDRKTGEKLWHNEWPGALKVPFFARANGSWIRSTPAYDEERLYVAGIRDVLVCLNAKTGEEHWRVDFVEMFQTPVPAFGFVCSPLVDGNAIYVQAGAAVVKLDKLSGKVLWRTLQDRGGMYGSAFSSPIIATLAGTRQLVVQTRSDLAGIDLTNGTILWQQNVPAFRGMNILTPIVVGDTLFTSNYKNHSWLYRITKQDEQFAVGTVWSNKTRGYMSTPVVVDGHVYLHLQNRRFTCLELETGAQKWKSRPHARYASLVVQRDRILALNSDGQLMLFKAHPNDFELLGKVKISDADTWAHLAVSGNELFVRELHALAAYRWENK